MYTITLKIIINFVAKKVENIYPGPTLALCMSLHEKVLVDIFLAIPFDLRLTTCLFLTLTGTSSITVLVTF